MPFTSEAPCRTRELLLSSVKNWKTDVGIGGRVPVINGDEVCSGVRSGRRVVLVQSCRLIVNLTRKIQLCHKRLCKGRVCLDTSGAVAR